MNRHFVDLNADHQALPLQQGRNLYITQPNTFIFYSLHFLLCLPNAEMTLDLEANEVEVKVLTSLVSVTGSTLGTPYFYYMLWRDRRL